jgi:hypothetical protein
MRALFLCLAVALFVWLPGCIRFPQMNLREPIYLVTHESLFVNCKKDPADESVCREYITRQIKAGAWQWARFFSQQSHPLFLIVESKDKVPYGAINPPVEIKVEAGMCGETTDDLTEACYVIRGYFSNPEIILTNLANLRPSLIAHELGHVLLGPDHCHGDFSSIMSDGSLVERVQAGDINRVCARHKECPARKSPDNVWEDEDLELDY